MNDICHSKTWYVCLFLLKLQVDVSQGNVGGRLLLLKGETLTVELKDSVGIQCVCPGQSQSFIGTAVLTKVLCNSKISHKAEEAEVTLFSDTNWQPLQITPGLYLILVTLVLWSVLRSIFGPFWKSWGVWHKGTLFFHVQTHSERRPPKQFWKMWVKSWYIDPQVTVGRNGCCNTLWKNLSACMTSTFCKSNVDFNNPYVFVCQIASFNSLLKSPRSL